MTRKEQSKILDAKIESNVNQYKVDRMNAEISAFSSGDLNKYEFLKRMDLNYKPNALDKTKFEFSPLGKTFSTGLDKTAQGYQEEGVIKLLKDIRDGLNGRSSDNRPNMNLIISLTMDLIIYMTIDLVINLIIGLMIVHLMMFQMMMVHLMMAHLMMFQILIKNIIVCCLNIFN